MTKVRGHLLANYHLAKYPLRFKVINAKLITQSQCKIKMDMMTQEQLILHVAIDHKLIDNFKKEIDKEMRRYGLTTLKIPSLKCPFQEDGVKCSQNALTPINLIYHVLDHCQQNVLDVIEELIKYVTGDDKTSTIKKCPIESCTLVFNIQNSDQKKLLLHHVAFVHLGVLQHLCQEYDKIKDEKSKQIIKKYAASVTGDEVICKDCKKCFGRKASSKSFISL